MIGGVREERPMAQADTLGSASRGPIAAPRKRLLPFSNTGIIFILMMLFMGVAAINSQANLLFGVFGLMIGVMLIAGVLSRLVLRGLVLRRALPEHGAVGHPLTISYELANRKRYWPSLSITVSEMDGLAAFTRQPQGYLLHAAAQTTATVPVQLVPRRRGLHELNRYRLATSFPFGFIQRSRRGRHKDVLVIYPAVARVSPRLLAMCRSAETTGETVRPRAGGSDEFYGVKEYRAGDNPRLIYWRRSARSGTLVAKEMTQVAPPRIALLVDTCLASRSTADHAAVERCIAMAASLAGEALDQGLSVGLCTWSNGWTSIAPTRGKRHRSELLSVLARLPLNTDNGLSKLLEECRSIMRVGTTPVLFTPWDVQAGVVDGSRGGMIVVSAESSRAQGWFRFEPAIDFANCMPADQRPLAPSPGASAPDRSLSRGERG